MEAKTKKTILIWGIVLLVLLNVSSLATIWYHRYQYTHGYTNPAIRQYRQEQHKLMRQNKRGHIQFLSNDLNLSDSQQQAFDSIWQHYAGQRLQLEKQLEAKRQKMSKLLSQPAIDTVAFHRLSVSQATAMQALNNSMLAMNMALRQTLTAEQMQLFLAKIELLNRQRGMGYSPRHRGKRKYDKPEK